MLFPQPAYILLQLGKFVMALVSQKPDLVPSYSKIALLAYIVGIEKPFRLNVVVAMSMRIPPSRLSVANCLIV